MRWNLPLIARLRDLASRGASVRLMVDEIRSHYEDADDIALEVDRYLTKAFFLRLRDVRNVEASACLGGRAYSDGQIDQLMLPLIASTQHLWAGLADGEEQGTDGVPGHATPDPEAITPGNGVQNPAASKG